MIGLWQMISSSVYPLKEYLSNYILEELTIICLLWTPKVEVLMH